jgi:hypothetical protein
VNNGLRRVLLVQAGTPVPPLRAMAPNVLFAARAALYARRELERRCELNRFVQRPVQRATHCVNAVRTLDCFPCRFGRHQSHGHVDAANDKHAIFRFDLSGDVRGQSSVARIDLTRLQRASKSAHHSTRGRRDDIVNSGGMRLLQLRWVNFVVLGDRSMDTVDHWLGLAWQMRDAPGALPTLDVRS